MNTITKELIQTAKDFRSEKSNSARRFQQLVEVGGPQAEMYSGIVTNKLQEIAKINNVIAEAGKKCRWELEQSADGENYYETECDNTICFDDSTVVECAYLFCPFCGHDIEVTEK